ncbi:MAG: YdcH family protein [Amphiplicatus sp.]
MEDGKPPTDDGDPPEDRDGETGRRFEAHEDDLAGDNDEALAVKLQILQQEHADLDAAIRALEAQPHHDRLSVARLKKKKLRLKDKMQAIKDQLTPDIIA